MKTTDGRLIVIAGASRCGKTTYTKRQVANDPRVLAWDIEDQWAQLRGYRKITTRREWLQAIQNPGPMRLAFVAGGNLKEEFNFWAQSVMYAGRYVGPLVCIAEELADVSAPGKAPLHWGQLVRRGLKRNITIYAISQRWSEADKTAFGNATEFVLFRQSSGDDVAYLSRKSRVDRALLDDLKPHFYIHYDALTGTVTPGKVKF